jgi:hypothetical protein
MWLIKKGVVLAKGASLERYYLESESGVRLVFIKADRGEEIFEYQDADLAFEVIATRIDETTSKIGDVYSVHLGIALKIASIRRPPEFMTLERARHIAANLKQAMLVWRYPPSYADALACDTSAHEVEFNMVGWSKWNPALEGRWP